MGEEFALEKSDLKAAWNNYVTSGTDPQKLIRPIIFDSWERCRELNVDPWQKKPNRILQEDEFQLLISDNQALIELCVPYMETLYAFVRGSGFVIALTDSDGILLKILGDDDIGEQIKTGGFLERADYSEQSVGTNAIGTALFLKEPIQVYSYEHFCRCAQVSTGSSAVIFDEAQQLIGSISLVGYDYNVHSHTLGMAVAAADAIHSALVMLDAQKACMVSDAYKSTIMDCISQAVMAVDADGFLTHLNVNAVRLLMPDIEDDYIGKNLQDFLPEENAALFDIIASRRRYTDKEMIVYTSRGALSISITTRVIQTNENGFAGMVVAMDEIKRVRKMVQKMSGAIASTTFDDLVGSAPQYLEAIRIAKNAALSNFNVLLLGESGAGKDVFAQAIHNYSNRKRGPFVVINCSAIPRELIGSELFGYVEGAYTGARKGGSTGKFELADGGTIFLDEIGDMPIDMQGHLLRVIEERHVTRIGGHETIPIDVHVIAATNRNLVEDIADGRFRQDLYYRLNVITIRTVPLRERMQDLPELMQRFYSKLAANLGKSEYPIPDDYFEKLSRYTFPGNIRELQNIIERSLILSADGKLEVSCLPFEVLRPAGVLPKEGGHESSHTKSEKDELYALLMNNKGNISKTAQELGMARSTLYRKMDRFGFQTTIAPRWKD